MDQMGQSSSWGPMAFTFTAGHAQKESVSNSGYLSTVLNSAKQKAAALRWPQLDPSPIGNPEGNKFATSITPSRWSTASEAIPATETEADELPLSSQIAEEQLEFPAAVAESSPAHDLPLTSDNYEKFKSEQEAKLKEWLEETKGCTESTEAKIAGACTLSVKPPLYYIRQYIPTQREQYRLILSGFGGLECDTRKPFPVPGGVLY